VWFSFGCMSTAAVQAATEITSDNVQMKSHMWFAPVSFAP